jgi:hypothetical protein
MAALRVSVVDFKQLLDHQTESEMRKKILDKVPPIETARDSAELDIIAIATALVTSEDPEHPIENAFDGRRGRGATRWVAGSLGE